MTLETTDAERLGWQRRAVSCLAEILKLAAKEGLPAIAWQIGPGPASVVGEFLDPAPARRRAQFAAWKDALARVAGRPADIDVEHVVSDEQTRLTAGWRELPVKLVPAGGPAPGVDVALVASIWHEEEGSGDGS